MKQGLLLCDDLLFASRIAGTANALGLPIRTVRSLRELHASTGEFCCVILDLALAETAIASLVAQLRAAGAGTIVAYGSHVDAATLKAARAAGCDIVLPRSKFVEALPTDIAGWFGNL